MSSSAQARRQQQVHRQETEWLLVSERHCCPICGATSSCHRDLEGAFACCARRTSDWPLTSGAWLHRVASADSAKREVVTRVEVVTLATWAEPAVDRASPAGSTH